MRRLFVNALTRSLNVIAKEFTDEIANALEPWVYGRVQQDRGSISAEHGCVALLWPH